jgi:predicted permease
MPINGKVLMFTLVASIATGVAVGMIPAWIASRTDVNSALKQGSRGSTGDRSRHLFRQGLIVCELALALVLLSGAGYFVRGMQRVSRADMGWKPDGLTTASLVLPYNASYSTDAECRAFFAKLEDKLAELPGVKQTAIASYLPITGFWRSAGVIVEGRPRPPHGSEPLFYYNSVSPGFFPSLGIRIEHGRGFTASARTLWPGRDPIGMRIEDADPAQAKWLQVVGVANDVESTIDFVRPPSSRFQVYLPLAQTPSGFVHWLNLAIRSDAPGPTLTAALRAAMMGIDADEPISAVISAPEGIEQLMRGFILTADMLTVFSLIGLALSAVGIYGVIANLVAQRTAEIGIRMALGAQARDVLWLVLGQGVRLSIAGSVIGLACAWGLNQLLHSLLPAIPGSDPLALAVLVALLTAVALFACWLPARRATLVNPIIALRSE